jgi:hypothetical protein
MPPSVADVALKVALIAAFFGACPCAFAGERDAKGPAEHRYARLRYEVESAAAGCASESVFRARVARRLGYDPFQNDAPRELRVHFKAHGSRAHADISLIQDGKPSGQRALEDPKCEALLDTVASAVALVLDPVAAISAQSAQDSDNQQAPDVDSTPPPPAPAPPAPPARVEHVDVPTPPPPPAQERDSLSPFAYVEATLGFARAPSALLGARIGGGARYGHFSLAGEAQFESTLSSASVTTGTYVDRIDVSLFSGALVPCGHLNPLFVCGVLALGRIQATALDVARPGPDSGLFSVLSLRAGGAFPIGQVLALRAQASLGLPLVRPAYVIDGATALTAPPFDVGLGIGAEARFR